jgi:hypothetical protein
MRERERKIHRRHEILKLSRLVFISRESFADGIKGKKRLKHYTFAMEKRSESKAAM